MSKFFHKDSATMKFMVWLEHMLHIQLLWLGTTFLGLVVGGIFPATAAMYSTMRQLIQKKDNLKINTFFWKEYKKNFLRANKLGYLLTVLEIIFVLNLKYSFNIDGVVGIIYIIISFALIIITLILLVSSWATMAHFNLNIREIIKHTLIILTMNPLYVVAILILLGVFNWSFYRLGILVPFISISIVAYFVMWFIFNASSKIKMIIEQRLDEKGDNY